MFNRNENNLEKFCEMHLEELKTWKKSDLINVYPSASMMWDSKEETELAYKRNTKKSFLEGIMMMAQDSVCANEMHQRIQCIKNNSKAWRY